MKAKNPCEVDIDSASKPPAAISLTERSWSTKRQLELQPTRRCQKPRWPTSPITRRRIGIPSVRLHRAGFIWRCLIYLLI